MIYSDNQNNKVTKKTSDLQSRVRPTSSIVVLTLINNIFLTTLRNTTEAKILSF